MRGESPSPLISPGNTDSDGHVWWPLSSLSTDLMRKPLQLGQLTGSVVYYYTRHHRAFTVLKAGHLVPLVCYASVVTFYVDFKSFGLSVLHVHVHVHVGYWGISGWLGYLSIQLYTQTKRESDTHDEDQPSEQGQWLLVHVSDRYM